MKVLVTGIAGFIASHVAERLLARGDDVVGIDNFDDLYERRHKLRNLTEAGLHDVLLEGDIRDDAFVSRIFAEHRFDVVVHCAALAGVRPSIAAPARYLEVNITGTCRIAEAMLAHGVKRLVFASSSSVYGDNADVPFSESHRVDAPASPYAASKRAGELLLRTYHKLHALDVTCLRFFTVYGPRQRPEMAIHRFCRLIASGQPITMFGDGQTSRDYTFVDDIADGTVAAIDKAPAGFHIYNLGNTRPIKLRDLIDKIGRAMGVDPIIEQAPHAPGDVMHTWADVSAAQRDLGYAPQVSIDEGLARFVEWMRST